MCSSAKARRIRTSRGSALIEFAISFSLVWILFSGVYSFGYAFYVYNRLQGAVSSATRYAATADYDSSNVTAYTNAVKNMVLYGDIAAGDRPIVPGLTTSHISVAVATDASSVPRDVTVSVADFSVNLLFRRISLTGKPKAVARYAGRWLCSGC